MRIDPALSVSTPLLARPHAAKRTRKRFHSVRLHQVMAASKVLRSIGIGLLASIEFALLAGHKDARVLDTIKQARRGRESLLSANEAFTLYGLAHAQAGLGGAMAEVGVYEGCSARVISLANGGASLHLFDTFAGLPEPRLAEKSVLKRGLYAASLASVRTFLADRTGINFHPGLFPATAGACRDMLFSFVHLDVDLKSSTLDCLEFFYPRMLPGGIILTHDYSYLDGVRTAFTEFLATRPERAIELPSSQAMIVKL